MIDVERDFERMRDYVGGRLADDERRTFEDRLARDPELVREFERTLRLREGLEQLREQRYFAKPAAGLTRRVIRYLPALAAAALAAVAIILWVQPRGAAPGVLRASVSGTALGAQFTFVAMRGSTSVDLDLPAAGLVEFRASPVSHATGARFRVTLVRLQPGGAEEPLGSLSGLVPGADGYLHAYADASRLGSGRYSLRVAAADQPGERPQSFPFQLRAR